MDRKLATIQRIREIKAHLNADSLELATVLGWQVVVKKGEFKPGDLCVFFEVDSILPDHPIFEFMRNKHFRIKTIRLRKELSQGLAMPLSIIQDVAPGVPAPNAEGYKEGDDVTERLGVQKYEVPVPAESNAKGNFPFFIPRTDEIRVQTLVPGIFDEINGLQLYVSLKVDGTSSTFFKHDNAFGACSRNLEIKENDNKYWNIARKYNLDTVLPPEFAIQGELCGPGIQKNRLNLVENELFVFNVYDILNRKYLDYSAFKSFVDDLGLKRVPCIDDCFIFDKTIHTLDTLLEMAKGKYAGTNNHREGIVIRPLWETYSDVLKGRLSFKVLNNDYLEKEQ